MKALTLAGPIGSGQFVRWIAQGCTLLAFNNTPSVAPNDKSTAEAAARLSRVWRVNISTQKFLFFVRTHRPN